jgi:hypothetical protein
MQLLTSIYLDAALLPHFVRHYRQLGVTTFRAVVNRHQRPSLPEQVERCGVVIAEVLDEPFECERTYAVLDTVRQRRVARSEWCLVADLDEFLAPPVPLPGLIRRCDHEGCDHLQGVLIDRLAEDGSFPELDERPLDEQFPMAGRITSKLTCGCDTKVPLMRGSCPIVPGLHRTEGRALPGVVAEVHHFKWSARVIDNIADRMCASYQQGKWYWREGEAVLDYERRHGRLRIDDPYLDIRRAWPPVAHAQMK